MRTRPVPSLVIFFASLAMISILVLGLQGAQAAVTTGSCDSAVQNGEMIDGSGNPTVIVAFGATSDVSDTDSLISIYIDFSGNGFSTDDLASLTTDSSTSGVGVYRDDGTTDDALDSLDTPLTMGDCSWSGNQVQITFSNGSEYVPIKMAGNYQWGIVIRTSDTVSDGDQIDNTLAAKNIVFSDGTTMPGKDIVANTITVDIYAPGSWANIDPSGWYTASQEPDVTVEVQDATSGLDTTSAYYSYSVDGGNTWSTWMGATVSGVDGSTNVETITAAAVPFDQDSQTQNMIQFEISDMVGNLGSSDGYTIMIDADGPDSWANLVPADWYTASQAPDVTIDVQDAVSGIDTATAYYQYSTDGGNSWSGWISTTVSGIDGSMNVETITASAVPFDQDSGTQNQIQFQLSDKLGNVGTSEVYTIEIDTMAPDDWADIAPAGWYTASQSPTVTISVQDTGSGLDTTSAFYSYSTDGGTTWNDWTGATVSGSDGSTSVETITADSVPFGQDSGDQNQIKFTIDDMLGNTGTSDIYTIEIDTMAPDSWANPVPAGWYTASQEPDVSIDVQDATAGLDTMSAFYSYSIDGGNSWSAWISASVSGLDGSTNVETITAIAVPFDEDSGTQNMIQFEINDMAGNTGSSGPYTIMIETVGPDNWANLDPSGWYGADQQPTVTIDVQDSGMGIDTATAFYQYSTDGGADWSGWIATTVTGSDGSNNVETITAASVPFDQDSGSLNQIQFQLSDMNGNSGTSPAYTILIDTTEPDSWANIDPSGYIGSQTPDVTIDVQDSDAGLDTASAYYQYSTDGGLSWSGWISATVTGADGSTNVETITASAVPFDQDSGTQNQIQFEISDMAGNTGTSGIYTIEIDSMAPDNWDSIDPTGWYTASQTPDVTISVQDTLTGIDTATAYYSYSTDGGNSWSGWMGATVTGFDGSTNVETITAAGVPFYQDSGVQNQIQFEINDMAGNTGTSGVYTIEIDTMGPDDWANIDPSGWYTSSQEPNETTISVQDTGAGLDTATAYYQYSTDGGSTWSDWISASVSGSDGSTNVETITAVAVPFDQDSGDQNQIQFEINDVLGNTGTSGTYTIQIDTDAPGSWAGISPSGWYTTNQAPTVTISVQDMTSGLDVSEAEYSFSTDGGRTWSGWTPAGVTGNDGTTAAETMTAKNVPFNMDSGSLDQIMFRIVDMAGLTGTSPAYTIMIDTNAPGTWAVSSPSGWVKASQSPTVTVDVQDLTSGLHVTTALYRYSTDTGMSWSAWLPAPMTGSDGTNAPETITAANVPFNQDSGIQNMIEFSVGDIAGLTGTSPEYIIKIDTIVPGGWAGIAPSGWYNSSQRPAVTVTVLDATSGLSVGAAEYRYSSDGGITWSSWTPATTTGTDGTTAAQTITALNVPFNLDSGALNQIEFRIPDIAGNSGTSQPYTIMIDTNAPGSWSGLSPLGWYNASGTPTVTITVKDVTSGLKVGDAQYQYSTNGGTTWSAWASATSTGTDGATDAQTLTALNVPFGADSGLLNKIRFRISDMALNLGISQDYVIRIDTKSPGSWNGITPSGWYTSSKAPTVTVSVTDNISGLDTAGAFYQFSTDGGATWSGWTAASVTGTDGSTVPQTLTAASVPFDQDSRTMNMLRFRIIDLAGNVGTSADYTIKIDTVSPGNWTDVTPVGWYNLSKAPTVTVQAGDGGSGLKVSAAQYQFSTDGGATWSAWSQAVITGTDGTTELQTFTAANVPFGQDSATLNEIRFRITDIAGNIGTSADYTIKIDSVPPGNWASVVPTGWYNQSRTPTVTVQAGDLPSGLNITSAQYQFSTDGGATWSAWIPATVTGTAGATGAQTITAANVSFNADSSNLNKIRFRITDMAGNVGTSAAYVIKVDTTAPLTSMPPLPKYSNTMALQLYFNASDNVSGIARLELWYRVNGGAYQQYSGNLTTSPLAFAATSDGLYEFYLRGLDNAGNYEAVPVTADANVTVKTSVPEPVVKIKEGTDTTESSAHVSGTVEPGSSVQVNGKAVTVDAAGNYAATVALSEGANKIKVTVTDPAGNTKTVEKTVNRKAASPMMTWLILALVIIIVAVVAAVLALRMRGKKPAPAEARAEPDRTAPPEAVAVPDQPAPEELPK